MSKIRSKNTGPEVFIRSLGLAIATESIEKTYPVNLTLFSQKRKR